MKVFIALLAVFAMACAMDSDCLQGITDPKTCCKDVPVEQEEVFLRNAENCATYYWCVAHEPLLMSCPEGLQWSINANRCEWPESAECEDPEKPSESNHL